MTPWHMRRWAMKNWLKALRCLFFFHALPDDNFRWEGKRYVRCSRCRNWRGVRG